MAEGLNVRITGKLRRFIEEQASPNGLYESAAEITSGRKNENGAGLWINSGLGWKLMRASLPLLIQSK